MSAHLYGEFRIRHRLCLFPTTPYDNYVYFQTLWNVLWLLPNLPFWLKKLLPKFFSMPIYVYLQTSFFGIYDKFHVILHPIFLFFKFLMVALQPTTYISPQAPFRAHKSQKYSSHWQHYSNYALKTHSYQFCLLFLTREYPGLLRQSLKFREIESFTLIKLFFKPQNFPLHLGS